jgi:glycosyltransferase 2 family protein
MPLRQIATLHFAGLFASLFLPGTAGGDALKLALIIMQFPSQKMSVALGLMLDRLSGFIVIVAWTAAAAWLREDWFAQNATATTTLRTALAIAGPLAGSLVLWFCMSRTGWMRTRMPDFPLRARLLKCEEVFDKIADQLTVSAAIFATSLIAFGAHFYAFHATALAFGGAVAIRDTFSVMPLIDMVTMLPITIAGIGLREHAFVQLFAPLCLLKNELAVVTSVGGFLITSAWALPGALAFLYIRPSMKKATGDV